MEESKCNGCSCYGCPMNGAISGSYQPESNICHTCNGNYSDRCYNKTCPKQECH